MSEDKSKKGREGELRIVGGQDYEAQYIRRKHGHLSHEQARAIAREARGDQQKAEQLAEMLRR
jgi:hypothetical protein